MYTNALVIEQSHSRLLAVADFQKGTLNLALLQPVVNNAQTSQEFNFTQMQLKLDELNIIDKIYFHNQTREAIYRDLMKNTASMTKISKLVTKLERQLMHERASHKEYIQSLLVGASVGVVKCQHSHSFLSV